MSPALSSRSMPCNVKANTKMVSLVRCRAYNDFCLTLTVRVILLGRLWLALRQYNLTLELLKLGLQLVQLTVRLFHDRRHVRQRFTIGRHFPQLLSASLYLQLLQRNRERSFLTDLREPRIVRRRSTTISFDKARDFLFKKPEVYSLSPRSKAPGKKMEGTEFRSMEYGMRARSIIIVDRYDR